MMRGVKHKLNKYRFSIYLFTQLMILFGSLFFPGEIYDLFFSPVFVVVNLIAGLFIIPLRSHFRKVFFLVFFVLLSEFVLSTLGYVSVKSTTYIRFFSYFLLYVVITYHLIKQIWRAEEVDVTMIMGLISGYISLGLIGFFMLSTIDMLQPEAFEGIRILETGSGQTRADNLLYFSFITLLTVGYGDILPALPVAQKATMIIGLVGQLYLVIITSITVGKYINQFKSKRNKSILK